MGRKGNENPPFGGHFLYSPSFWSVSVYDLVAAVSGWSPARFPPAGAGA